ncbi:MAG: TIGR04013 family B12-binding domain/radical SAM domain-containing protein [Methanomicrobiales archaeon]|nr:TIGR04013 family B12-binding domain/radical SAM domain-containing protein [Methanomicrobiales archaeon]
MRVNWRVINAAASSYAPLFASCAEYGFYLRPVDAPAPDITCYSLNSVNEPAFREEIARAGCTTIVGGPHASACPEQVAAYADYVVVGEGEFTLPRLLSRLEEGGTGPVPGVVCRGGTLPTDHTVILDAFPPFSVMKGYIEISRGCPFGCAYCQTPCLFGSTMRHRSIDTIVRFASRYHDIRFVSPNALAYGSDGRTPRLEKVAALLSRLSGNIYFGTFPSEVRPEFISGEALDLIASCRASRRIAFGAQSGSDRILSLIRRGHTIADVIAAVECCRAHDFVPSVDFILGFPFETAEDEEETLGLIRWVTRHGKARVHAFIPLPGTALAGTVPRPLSRHTLQILGNLALHGRITGSWNDPAVRFFKARSDI